MIDRLVSIAAGCVLGILTGLVPGIHVNTLSLLVLAFAWEGDLNLVLLIVAMSVVHSFVDFVPSILLGAPESESFLAVLPGHRLLLKGLGLYAVKLTAFGGLVAGVFSLLFAPIFLLFIGQTIEFFTGVIPFLLMGVLGLMLLSEKGAGRKIYAALVIALSALLGVLTLQGNFPLQNSLFPLVTGFFGCATLLYSLNKKAGLEEQKIRRAKFNAGTVLKGSAMSLVAGSAVALFPSLSSNEAAFVLRKLVGRIRTVQYLVILGGINTASMILSFFTLYAIGKARTGSAAAVKELLLLQPGHLLFISAAVLIALGFAYFAANSAARRALKLVQSMDYRVINSLILAFVCALVFVLSGAMGLAVMGVATAVGLLAVTSKIKRTHCMAFLIVPTILIYLGINVI